MQDRLSVSQLSLAVFTPASVQEARSSRRLSWRWFAVPAKAIGPTVQVPP
ncbi:hypothetical protein [Amycolatopsis rubida]|nr:hypothetical protein [Amycolatopsis rubida]